MFKLLKIQYVVAPNDAEAYCSLLCNTRKVSGVLSNDTDCYVFGIRNNDYILATNLNIKKETIIIIRPKEILESLNLKMLEFIDFCICCGCDYNRNIKGIGPEKSFKLIKKYKSIEQINGVDTEILNVVRCREIFNLTTNSSEVCIRVRYCNNVVKWENIRSFLIQNHLLYDFAKLNKKKNMEKYFIECFNRSKLKFV